MTQAQERRFPDDPSFASSFVVELGARLRRYQDESGFSLPGSLPGEFVRLLHEIDAAEAALNARQG